MQALVSRRTGMLLFIAMQMCLGLNGHAQNACDSDQVLLPFRSCRHPGNGFEYALERTKWCGVESYNTCQYYAVESKEFDFTVNWNEKPRQPDSDSEQCLSAIKQKAMMDMAIESGIENYLIVNKNSFPSDLSEKSRRVNAVVEVTSTSSRAVGTATMVFSNASTGQHQARCKMKIVFDTAGNYQDEHCNVRTYNSCRHPEHKTNIFREARSQYCGYDIGSIVVKLAGKKEDPRFPDSSGTVECATEGTVADIRKRMKRIGPKYKALQLEMLLEIYNKEAAANATFDSLRLLKEELETELDSWAMGSNRQENFNVLFVGLGDASRLSRANTLRQLFPQEFAVLKKEKALQLLWLSPGLYAAFYDGTSLSTTLPALQHDAQLLAELTEDRPIYRQAESIVRSGLSQIREIQYKSMKLMDLRIRLHRGSTSAATIAQEMGQISKDNIERVLNELKSYEANQQRLREAAENIIDARVRSANYKVDAIKKLITYAEQSAHRSKDIRVPLLKGYIALQELNGNAFTQSIRTVSLNLKKSAEVAEVQNSIQLLSKSAQTELKSLESFSKLLQNSQSSKAAIQQSLIGLLADTSKDSDALDNLTSLVFGVLAKFKGGPGAEFSLEEELTTLLQDTYADFITTTRAGQKIP